MTDEQLENLLRGVRPVGPSPDVRMRITAARPVGRAWPWMAAAAALLALTVLLQLSAARVLRDIRPPAVSENAAFDMDRLRDSFNLDDNALQAMVLRRELARRLGSDEGEPVSR